MAPSAPRPRKRRRRATTTTLTTTAAAANQPDPPAAPDRFSNLSDDLLLAILSRLPTRLAVSVCLLARRFRHLPTLFPRLDSLSPSSTEFPLPPSPPLLLRRLSLTPSPNLPASAFRSLLADAAAHGVSELSIHLPRRARIHGAAISIRSLAVLSLTNCAVPRWAIATCPRLRTLKLERVAIHQDILSAILVSAPALETLQLVYCTGFGARGGVTVEAPAVRNFVLRPPLELQGAVVRAPALREVALYTRPKMWKLELAPAPEVRKAYLHIAHLQRKLECQLRPFLEAGTGLVCLTLRGAAMKLLSSEYEEIPKLGVSFEDLRILSVSLDFSSESELVFLLKLLESCPNIRELNLSAAEAHKENASPSFSEHKRRLAKIQCLTKNLTQFKFVGFKPEQYEKELVVFILTQAKKLKKMMLEFLRPQANAVKEILSVRKAPIERRSTRYNCYRVQLEFS